MSVLNDFPRLFGLIGYPLSHSFSKQYFKEKFQKEHISDAYYELFPIERIENLPSLIQAYPNLVGLNVTIPYKEKVISYLDDIDPEAEAVAAVNTIRIQDGQLKGYNTDVFGFEHSLRDLLDQQSSSLQALILGTGGAAKAIAFILNKLNIPFQYVSRSVGGNQLSYEQLDDHIISAHQLIINTTPLGTFPNINERPDIPYQALSQDHYLYDLVYNPLESAFLKSGKEKGATVINGLVMLHLQAEEAWRIWNRA